MKRTTYYYWLIAIVFVAVGINTFFPTFPIIGTCVLFGSWVGLERGETIGEEKRKK